MGIPNGYDYERTGKISFRPGWFGLVIPMVEVRVTEYSLCPPMPGRDRKEWFDLMRSEGEKWLVWRDATWADLRALGYLAIKSASPI